MITHSDTGRVTIAGSQSVKYVAVFLYTLGAIGSANRLVRSFYDG